MIVVLESVTKVGIRIVIVFKTAAAVLFSVLRKARTASKNPPKRSDSRSRADQSKSQESGDGWTSLASWAVPGGRTKSVRVQ